MTALRRWIAVLISSAVLLLLPHNSFATAQIPEILVVEGEEYPMYSTPLKAYLESLKERPKALESNTASTALWRGYRGRWVLEDKTLKLQKVEIQVYNRKAEESEWQEVPLKEIVSGSSGAVPAAWFSGMLRIPLGEQLRYVHMGFMSTSEKERLFRIEKGKIVKDVEIQIKGADPYRSHPDLRWTALGDPEKAPFDFEDARSIDWKKSGTKITTRGLYFPGYRTEPAILLIPATEKTEGRYLALRGMTDAVAAMTTGSHVEVSGLTLAASGNESEGEWKNRATIAVTAIRALEPGCSIHHPDFIREAKGNANGEKEKASK